jgi:outer membrane protein assembly factor BamB
VLWRHALGKGDTPDEPPVFSGGLALVLTHADRRLDALDPSTGRTRWKLDVSYQGIRYAGGMLLLTGADGKVTGVDSASGETKWTRRIPGLSRPYFTSFGNSPLVYATSASDNGSHTRVTAVDPETGDVRWDTRLSGTLTPVGVSRGSVLFLSSDGDYGMANAVVRYSPETKVSLRVMLTVPVDQAQTAVYQDHVFLLGAGGSLVAVDTGAGKQLWSLETSVSQSSAPVADGRHVYFTAGDGRLLAVDAAKGRLLGQTPPRLGTDSEVVATLPAPAIAGSHVYATAPDGTVFAVSAGDPSAW